MPKTWPSFITEFTQSAHLAEFTSGLEEHDFIPLLALIQRLRISILPIAWQTALDPLGEGGQARVDQSLINDQTSFAFKRFSDSSGTDRVIPFREVINELIVHSQPTIKEHPYIVDLVGVCWISQRTIGYGPP